MCQIQQRCTDTPHRLFAIKLQPVNSADEQTLSLLNNANQTYFVHGQAGEFGLNGSICGYDAYTHSLVVSQRPNKVQGRYTILIGGSIVHVEKDGNSHPSFPQTSTPRCPSRSCKW